MKIGGIGKRMAESISGTSALSLAEEELNYITKNEIEVLYFLDDEYPRRLRHCEDGPVVLYSKGSANLNKQQVIAIVGTRNATQYGKDFCQQFMQELKPFNPLVISGLAYGIDTVSHQQALQNGLPTVGVLGHGLDRIYPATNRKLAGRMLENGGLITEFVSGTNPDAVNFPKRNRIVAGISDAVVVVEAAKQGGALITAKIANSYNREVFAVPGRLSDPYSEGCNHLIATNQAALLHSVNDLKYLLGWEAGDQKDQVPVQHSLPLDDFNSEEQKIIRIMQSKEGKIGLEDLCFKANSSASKVLPLLMNLELKGVVRSLPGRVYAL